MKVPEQEATESANDGAAAGSGSGLVQLLFGFVDEVVASANTLIEVHSDRIKLSVRRKIVQAAIGAAAGLCLAFWLGAAALAIVRGLCGGLASLWGGRVWLGDLTGGVIALTLAAGGVALFLRLSNRREIERLERKYARIRSKLETEQDQPAADGGAAARSGGSPGDPTARGLGAQTR